MGVHAFTALFHRSVKQSTSMVGVHDIGVKYCPKTLLLIVTNKDGARASKLLSHYCPLNFRNSGFVGSSIYAFKKRVRYDGLIESAAGRVTVEALTEAELPSGK